MIAAAEQERAAYLASPIGRARASIAKAAACQRALTDALNGLSTALTIGNGTAAQRKAVFDATLALRLAVADADTFARMVEATDA